MNAERVFTRAELALIEKHRDFNVQDEWYEYTKNDLAEQLKEFTGMAVKDSNFSGFWSQGDGASFECYTDKLQDMLDVAEKRLAEFDAAHAAGTETGDDPIKAAVIKFARWIVDTFGKYRLLGDMLSDIGVRSYRSGSMYCHEMTMQAEFEHAFDEDREVIVCGSGLFDVLDDEVLLEHLRDIARGYYKALEDEHDHQTSDEAVWDSLEANDIKPEADDEEDDDAIAE
jgi:hypothetical protein